MFTPGCRFANVDQFNKFIWIVVTMDLSATSSPTRSCRHVIFRPTNPHFSPVTNSYHISFWRAHHHGWRGTAIYAPHDAKISNYGSTSKRSSGIFLLVLINHVRVYGLWVWLFPSLLVCGTGVCDQPCSHLSVECPFIRLTVYITTGWVLIVNSYVTSLCFRSKPEEGTSSIAKM